MKVSHLCGQMGWLRSDLTKDVNLADGELEDISKDVVYHHPTIAAPQHQIFSEGCQCWLLQKLLQTTVATVRMLQFLQQFGSDQLAISMPGTRYQ